MINVGEDTFLGILAMYGNILVEERGFVYYFTNGAGEVVGRYDRRKGHYLVSSEDIRRITGSGRLDSH